jgi:imidazolonepropionase-like amidohydrolase
MAGLIAVRRRLYQSGAVLVSGSDAGVSPAKPHNVLPFAPGDLAAAGLSPAEILQAMTSRAAQACGFGHRKGRIAPGFDADILAIGRQPARRPRRHPQAARRVRRRQGSPLDPRQPG